MKIGLMFMAGHGAMDIAPVARAAEERGFGSLWVQDHVASPLDFERPVGDQYEETPEDGDPYDQISVFASAMVTLARAAAVTERLKVGTAICLPNLRNAICLAHDVATLDRDSGGRFLFGVGGGWFREEMELLGGDYERRGRQLADSVAAMKALWTQDEASHEGPYYNFSRVRLLPKPNQKPHPPIILGGESPRIYDRVMRWADGWMPTIESAAEYREKQAPLLEAAKRHGRDVSELIQVSYGVPRATRDVKEIETLRELGVDHAIISLIAVNEDALREIDELEPLVRALA